MPSTNSASVCRVMLVDDQQQFHDAITALLRTVTDIKLVANAYNGEDAVALCKASPPDLILMDVSMPGIGGSKATKAILEANPQITIVALSSYRDYEDIKEMLDSGAIGYLVKDAIAEDLIATIRATSLGNTVFSPEVARIVLAPPAPAEADAGLTEREIQVLKLIAQGQTNAQIASNLGISQPTVRFHTNNILLKLGVETRSEALVMAARRNLV